MYYTDDRYRLRVRFDTKQCSIPADELTRMQSGLAELGRAVETFPDSELGITVIHHPRSATYHVEAKLKLPGQTLFTGDRDVYLDSAFQRAIRKLINRVSAYKEHPDRTAEEAAEHATEPRHATVTPANPDSRVLDEAARAGNYRVFRTALTPYEEWLRKRVGRWLQRYPEAEAQIGHGLAIGDVVEEVYLNAFERYGNRPAVVSISDWLEDLIDPSLKLLLTHPDEERENASFARTVRAMAELE